MKPDHASNYLDWVHGPYKRPGLLSRVMRWLGGWVGVS